MDKMKQCVIKTSIHLVTNNLGSCLKSSFCEAMSWLDQKIRISEENTIKFIDNFNFFLKDIFSLYAI